MAPNSGQVTGSISLVACALALTLPLALLIATLVSLQPTLKPAAGRHRPQAQHLQIGRGELRWPRQTVGEQDIPGANLPGQLGGNGG